MLRLSNTIVVMLFLTMTLQPIHGQTRVSLGQIKKSLTCTCACAMTVDACEGSMTCGEAARLAAEASRMIEQGMEEDAILVSFISRYGEQILAAPTKKGFNLLAWIMPFALTLIAGFGITRILRRWVSSSKTSQVVNRKINATPGERRDYANRLDDILRGLD